MAAIVAVVVALAGGSPITSCDDFGENAVTLPGPRFLNATGLALRGSVSAVCQVSVQLTVMVDLMAELLVHEQSSSNSSGGLALLSIFVDSVAFNVSGGLSLAVWGASSALVVPIAMSVVDCTFERRAFSNGGGGPIIVAAPLAAGSTISIRNNLFLRVGGSSGGSCGGSFAWIQWSGVRVVGTVIILANNTVTESLSFDGCVHNSANDPVSADTNATMTATTTLALAAFTNATLDGTQFLCFRTNATYQLESGTNNSSLNNPLSSVSISLVSFAHVMLSNATSMCFGSSTACVESPITANIDPSLDGPELLLRDAGSDLPTRLAALLAERRYPPSSSEPSPTVVDATLLVVDGDGAFNLSVVQWVGGNLTLGGGGSVTLVDCFVRAAVSAPTAGNAAALFWLRGGGSLNISGNLENVTTTATTPPFVVMMGCDVTVFSSVVSSVVDVGLLAVDGDVSLSGGGMLIISGNSVAAATTLFWGGAISCVTVGGVLFIERSVVVAPISADGRGNLLAPFPSDFEEPRCRSNHSAAFYSIVAPDASPHASFVGGVVLFGNAVLHHHSSSNSSLSSVSLLTVHGEISTVSPTLYRKAGCPAVHPLDYYYFTNGTVDAIAYRDEADSRIWHTPPAAAPLQVVSNTVTLLLVNASSRSVFVVGAGGVRGAGAACVWLLNNSLSLITAANPRTNTTPGAVNVSLFFVAAPKQAPNGSSLSYTPPILSGNTVVATGDFVVSTWPLLLRLQGAALSCFVCCNQVHIDAANISNDEGSCSNVSGGVVTDSTASELYGGAISVTRCVDWVQDYATPTQTVSPSEGKSTSKTANYTATEPPQELSRQSRHASASQTTPTNASETMRSNSLSPRATATALNSSATLEITYSTRLTRSMATFSSPQGTKSTTQTPTRCVPISAHVRGLCEVLLVEEGAVDAGNGTMVRTTEGVRGSCQDGYGGSVGGGGEAGLVAVVPHSTWLSSQVHILLAVTPFLNVLYNDSHVDVVVVNSNNEEIAVSAVPMVLGVNKTSFVLMTFSVAHVKQQLLRGGVQYVYFASTALPCPLTVSALVRVGANLVIPPGLGLRVVFEGAASLLDDASMTAVEVLSVVAAVTAPLVVSELQVVAGFQMLDCAPSATSWFDRSIRALSPVAITDTCEGLVAGNLLVLILLAVASAFVASLYMCLKNGSIAQTNISRSAADKIPKVTWLESAAATRCPSVVFLVAVAMQSGMMVCGVRLLQGDGYGALGGIAIGVAFAHPVAALLITEMIIPRRCYRITEELWWLWSNPTKFHRIASVFYTPSPKSPSPKQLAVRLFLPRCELDGNIAPSKAFAAFVANTRFPHTFWASFPSLLPLALGIPSLASGSTCTALFGFVAAIYVVFACVYFILMPHRVIASNWLLGVALLLNALLAILAGLASDQRGGDAALDGYTTVAILQMVVTCLRVIHYVCVEPARSFLVRWQLASPTPTAALMWEQDAQLIHLPMRKRDLLRQQYDSQGEGVSLRELLMHSEEEGSEDMNSDHRAGDEEGHVTIEASRLGSGPDVGSHVNTAVSTGANLMGDGNRVEPDHNAGDFSTEKIIEVPFRTATNPIPIELSSEDDADSGRPVRQTSQPPPQHSGEMPLRAGDLELELLAGGSTASALRPYSILTEEEEFMLEQLSAIRRQVATKLTPSSPQHHDGYLSRSSLVSEDMSPPSSMPADREVTRWNTAGR